MSDAIQPPVATGNLAKTPFVHLVLYLYQHRGSGTLIVRTTSGEHRVLFHRGRAVAARVPQPSAAIDQALMPLSALMLGDFEFHEADLVGSGPAVLTGMFDPFVFAVEAARKHARPEIVAGLLAKYVAVPLRLEPTTELSRLGLTPEELRFVQPLTQGSVTIETLLTQSGLSPDAARRILYSLLITRSVGPEGAGRDSQRTAASSPARESQPTAAATAARRSSQPDNLRRPSRPLSERLRPSGDAWRAIASRAGEMAESRRPSEPRPAPVRTTPRPPRAPSQSSPRAVEAPLSQPPERSTDSRAVRRPGSSPISEPLGAAGSQRPDSRPLTPAPFRESMSSGMPRTTPSAPLGRVTPRPSLPDVSTLDSAGKFRRVELLCQRNSFDEALPIIRGLIEQDRKSAKYLGMLSSVLFGRTTTEETISKEIVESVNQALRIDPDQVHALYTKARCYKRVGKEREALHYFRRTVAVDPSHLDAAREVRLLISRLNDKRKR